MPSSHATIGFSSIPPLESMVKVEISSRAEQRAWNIIGRLIQLSQFNQYKKEKGESLDELDQLDIVHATCAVHLDVQSCP